MTDSIDLDEIDTGEEESDDANDGDWFWGDGEAPEETATVDVNASADANAVDADTDTDAVDADTDTDAVDADTDADADDANESGTAIPHVPYDNKNQPAGIPVEQGGSGAGAGQSGGERAKAPADKGQMQEAGGQSGQASGPHGGDADDMTTAFTLNALHRLENVQRALADTNQWSDWIGIVGDVESHTIQKFQRDHELDADFFNGTGSNPAERLAEIDPTSMFYAKRMVVIGVEGEEWFADAEEWEFVPLKEAADGADWGLVDAESREPAAGDVAE